MYVDPKKLEDLSFSQIVTTFLDEGFEILGSSENNIVLALPGDDRVIKITGFTSQAKALERIVKDNEGNPHLPMIYERHEFQADMPVSVTVMEKLHKLEEIPQVCRGIFGGFARALALILERDDRHDDLSEHFMSNEHVASAILSILNCLKDSLDEEGKCLFYQRGHIEPSKAIEDWYPERMLFRQLSDGKRWLPVFADPFFEADLTHNDLEEYRKTLSALDEELRSYVTKRKGPEEKLQGPSFN